MLRFIAAIMVLVFMPLSMYTIALALEWRTVLTKCVAAVCTTIYGAALFQLLILD